MKYNPASLRMSFGYDQPPVTSTDPSFRSVAVCPNRPAAIVPTGTVVPAEGSRRSTVAIGSPDASAPPTINTVPSGMTVEVF
jgi:hypothetical protein